jgi:hypothetical protein
MKKFLFVAILAAGSLVACNDTSNTVNGVDTTTQEYRDSMARVNGTSTDGSTMGTGTDTMGTGGSMMGTDTTGTGGSMMGSDTSSSMMSTDSSK